ncbi:extracellular solute-binding protein [Paenibacillus sp. GCM10027626]|uniref:extracellular solute-binding protein n=1 Tax=Paenibacillus sp. GCM10027626 TaxID=3273411 RepID=UPI00363A07A5
MRKKTMNVFSTAFAVILAAGTVLAGCGNSKEEGSKNNPLPAAGNSEKQTKEGSAPETGKRGKVSVTIYDRGQISPDEGTYDNNRWTKWVNEHGPVDVTYVPVPRTGSDQKIPVIFASGTAPDLVLEYSATMRNQLWVQKQLMPLDEMIDKYSTNYKKLLEQFPQLKRITAMPDGKPYQIGKVMKPTALIAMVIRKDWLDKLNLKVPETVDEFYDVAYAFAHQDPDGNGKDDTYGFNMNQHTIIDKMFGSELFIIENGELVRQFDRIKPAAEIKKKLFENGVVDKDFLTDKTGQKAQQDFANGKTGIFVDYVANIKKNYGILKDNDPNADIIPILLPESSFGKYSPDFNSPLDVVGVVNANAKDPQAVMQYIDFMLEPSTMEYFQFGEEGVYYTKGTDGTPEVIDRDKKAKEIDYNSDYQMFMSSYAMKEYQKDGVALNSTDPFDQEWIKISQQMDKMYVDPSRPTPGYTHFKIRPNLEKGINATVDGGWTQWHDIILKAIVSNGDLDQAVQQIKDAWYSSGGQKAEDWHKSWYNENKDKWVFMDDLYNMKF